jgi:WhiB family redox-sensing transcriptional regulator
VNDTEDWRNQALCRNHDAEWWFPTGGAHTYMYAAQAERALAICRTCPVRQPCLEYALACLPHGVAGGTTEAQRSRLRLENPARAPRPIEQPTRPECGTEAGYMRHRRRGEQTCQPCKNAGNEAWKQRKARQREAAS